MTFEHRLVRHEAVELSEAAREASELVAFGRLDAEGVTALESPVLDCVSSVRGCDVLGEADRREGEEGLQRAVGASAIERLRVEARGGERRAVVRVCVGYEVAAGLVVSIA